MHRNDEQSLLTFQPELASSFCARSSPSVTIACFTVQPAGGQSRLESAANGGILPRLVRVQRTESHGFQHNLASDNRTRSAWCHRTPGTTSSVSISSKSSARSRSSSRTNIATDSRQNSSLESTNRSKLWRVCRKDLRDRVLQIGGRRDVYHVDSSLGIEQTLGRQAGAGNDGRW